MILQTLVVALLVIGCTAYAAWTLMPASPRRAIALALLKLPLPGAFAATMRKSSLAPSGCACDGCDAGGAKTAAAAAVQPIHFQPRPRR